MAKQVTCYALGASILTPFCLLFPYGYSIGNINSAAKPIRDFYNQTYTDRHGIPLSDSALNLLWALTASLFPVGGMIGAPFVRPLVAKFGRRNTLVYSQIVCIFAAILMSVSTALKSFECIIVARVVLGLYGAVATGVGSIYISEITVSHLRAPVGSLFSVAIVTGILSANVLGLKEVLGTTSGWPYLLAITGAPAVLYLLYSPLLPKSPRALYLDCRKPDEARRVLQRLRGTEDVSKEMNALEQQAKEANYVKPMSIKQVLCDPSVKWQLLSTIVIMSSFQLSGINGVQFYLHRVYLTAGIPEDIIVYVSLGTLCCQILVTISSGFLIERFGRKTLLLLGNGIICISIVLYTIATGLQVYASWLSYISAVAAIGFILGYCIGPAPVTYVVVPELLDQSSRPAAMTLGVFCLWTSFATVGFVTPYLFQYLTFAAFTPFLFIVLCALAFVYYIVPETKGKSVLAIQARYAKLNKVSNAKAIDTTQQELKIISGRETNHDEDDNLLVQ